MQRRPFALLLLVASVVLSGCQTLVDETGPLAVRSVAVSAKPTVKSETDLVPPLQEATSRALVGGDPAGTPVDVAISIDQVSYKNAVMSMLVGSTNALDTTVTVTDEGGAVLATFPHATMLDGAFNGVVGALIAVSQERADVDAKLVRNYADQIKRRIYGKPGHKPRKPAPARPASPAAAPAPPGSPAAPSAAPAIPAAVPTA